MKHGQLRKLGDISCVSTMVTHIRSWYLLQQRCVLTLYKIHYTWMGRSMLVHIYGISCTSSTQCILSSSVFCQTDAGKPTVDCSEKSKCSVENETGQHLNSETIQVPNDRSKGVFFSLCTMCIENGLKILV